MVTKIENTRRLLRHTQIALKAETGSCPESKLDKTSTNSSLVSGVKSLEAPVCSSSCRLGDTSEPHNAGTRYDMTNFCLKSSQDVDALEP